MRSPSPHSDLPPLKNVRKVLSKSTQHMPSLHLFMPSAEAANHLFDRQTRDMHPVIRLTPRNPRREFRLYKKTGRKEGRMGNRAIFPPPPPHWYAKKDSHEGWSFLFLIPSFCLPGFLHSPLEPAQEIKYLQPCGFSSSLAGWEGKHSCWNRAAIHLKWDACLSFSFFGGVWRGEEKRRGGGLMMEEVAHESFIVSEMLNGPPVMLVSDYMSPQLLDPDEPAEITPAVPLCDARSVPRSSWHWPDKLWAEVLNVVCSSGALLRRLLHKHAAVDKWGQLKSHLWAAKNKSCRGEATKSLRSFSPCPDCIFYLPRCDLCSVASSC